MYLMFVHYEGYYYDVTITVIGTADEDKRYCVQPYIGCTSYHPHLYIRRLLVVAITIKPICIWYTFWTK